MKNNLSTKTVWALSLAFFLWHLLPAEGFAQEAQTRKNALVNLGHISFSPDYSLADDASFIVFKIRNNSARPISNIFAWIYKFTAKKDEKPSDFVLVNNPNRGGWLVKGGSHAPGEIAEWRFPLTGAKASNEQKYTFRVSSKSIFFGDKTLRKTEPSPGKPQ